ncbi:MAG: transcription antitermination factor NusB [Pirellulales bacterium]
MLRSRAREVVLQILYQDDLNPRSNIQISEAFLKKRLNRNQDLVAFAKTLLLGTREKRKEIDGLIAQAAENWRLERMAVTDRNVLRMGTYEMLHVGTPGRVVINEAVELARRFGSKDSAKFVNGILDRILKRSVEASGPAAPKA